MSYEDFVALWNMTATDDEAHKEVPGSSAFLHALYTVLSEWNSPKDKSSQEDDE